MIADRESARTAAAQASSESGDEPLQQPPIPAEAALHRIGDDHHPRKRVTPVASRLVTYAVSLAGEGLRYQEALLRTRAMCTWTEAALEETEFVPMDEPYATPRG